jgi:hypothetical protein
MENLKKILFTTIDFHTKSVDDVIRDAIKETNWRSVDSHPTYLDKIIKF